MSELLDDFGSELMLEARDEAVAVLDRLVEGRDESDRGRRMSSLLGELSAREVEACRALALEAVDITLHYVLWMFERSDRFDIVDRRPQEQPVSVRDLSDGLSGELYTEDGWIARFSRFGQAV